jgi:hypothetical protein
MKIELCMGSDVDAYGYRDRHREQHNENMPEGQKTEIPAD